MASTRSLLHSRPSWAANPPSKRSRMKTPGSSVLRTSLMPSCSLESRLCSVTWKLSSREEQVVVVVSVWPWVRLPNRRSRSTVRCSTVQGCDSTARAWLWDTLLMSKLFTCQKIRYSNQNSSFMASITTHYEHNENTNITSIPNYICCKAQENPPRATYLPVCISSSPAPALSALSTNLLPPKVTSL